jgi:hypothetical protein
MIGWLSSWFEIDYCEIKLTRYSLCVSEHQLLDSSIWILQMQQNERL